MALWRLTACLLVAVCVCLRAGAQTAQVVHAGSAPPETVTLDEAIRLATANQPAFAAASAERRALALERTNARAALLPTLAYHNQVLYTQPNGLPASRIGQTTGAPAPVFIANNAVREYTSQGVVNETLGFAQVGEIRLADANAARADAELEIARRGLVSAVITLYFNVGTGALRVSTAQQALTEAARFLDTTQKREAAREVAHADVLKAELLQQGRQRELADTHLRALKARLELGVLLFRDPSTPYAVNADIELPVLPSRAAVDQAASSSNPELRSALASLRASQAESYAARTALLPQLNLNVTYGIDATNAGVHGPDGIRNLGYSGSAQLDLPVFDWFIAERRIKQSVLRQGAAAVALTAAQRRLMADLAEDYAEAEAARDQLASFDGSVVAARESLRLTELRYEQGESSVLEVVDAQSTLTATENARIDGTERFRLALANLQLLTGTF